MAEQVKIPFTTGNRIWATYKNYPYKAWYAVAELVDNSTQEYFNNKDRLDAVYKKEGSGLEVSIVFDPDTRTLEVIDNSIGMDLLTLSRAVLLAEPPENTSGRSEFGMGMKTACSWLGSEWGVRTKKLGDNNEYSFNVNIPKHAISTEQSLVITVKAVDDVDAHYTVVTVKNVRQEFQGTAISTLKRRLAEIYRRDIESGQLILRYNTDILEPPVVSPLKTTVQAKDDEGNLVEVTHTWKRDVEFDITLDEESGNTAKVTGWIAVIVPGGRNKAGFDLFRRGRVIVGRPSGYRPEAIFGTDAPNNVLNQRLFGQLNLDNFPVNHLKSDFQWQGWKDEFDAKLKEVAEDYINFAKKYRPTQAAGDGGVSPAVVHAANDEVAESLDSDALATEIEILETMGPPPLPEEEVKQAEADVLRDQPHEPRVVQLRDKTFAIYHPVGMKPEQEYMKFQAADKDRVDIFINDNHPYVGELDVDEGGADRYQEHIRDCVHDAMAAHILTNLGKGDCAETFLRVKDQLLRRM